MSKTVFDQMLARYDTTTTEQKHNALHEVMQQITLSALYRAGFFSRAAFYGGTCLRIFHDLPRFSEDMDFTLIQPDEEFSLEDYFEELTDEFRSYGRKVDIQRKAKKVQSGVESAFLKDNTDIANIMFQTERSVKIKIEVDKTPPMDFETEDRLLLLPYSFTTRCMDLKGLFSGKIHAFIFRNWKTRVKGRDWFDFEWYIRRDQPADFLHLKQRIFQTGYKADLPFTPDTVKQLLKEKIQGVDMRRVVDDVRPFIDPDQDIQIWSKDYFIQLVDRLKFH